MGYTGERFNLKRLTSQSLAVTEYGITKCTGGHSVPLRVYGHYSIHFILSGQGTFEQNGTVYHLSSGQGFMIFPDVANSYVADEKNPFTYIYANFSGPDEIPLVHYSGLTKNNPVFSFPLHEDFVGILTSMHTASKSNQAKGYDVTGYFLLAISQLIKENSLKENAYLPEHYVSKAISYMEDNYNKDITIQKLANHIGLDRTYLYRLFVKTVSISPNEYLLNYRLERSVVLLEERKLSLSEIALFVGFYDLAHFSNAFKRKYKISPGQYRKNILHL